MELSTLLILGLLFAGSGVVLLMLFREMVSTRAALKDHVLDLSRQVQEQMRENTRFLQETYQGHSRSADSLQHRLGELYEATQSMVRIGQDISSLQDILKAPKLRGGLGELLLTDVLRQVLPEEHFSVQFAFESGERVDAVIHLTGGLVPVDAKFPLENFRRSLDAEDEKTAAAAKKQFQMDVQRHIDCIASKYILPSEGTFEFALMYIPAENVYYEAVLKNGSAENSLIEYARRKRVIPVSPNSFYAYLQAIAHGLKGLRIEKSAQVIMENLGQLEMDFRKCLAEFEKLGAHLSHARAAFEKTEKRFDKIGDKIESLGMAHKDSREPSTVSHE